MVQRGDARGERGNLSFNKALIDVIRRSSHNTLPTAFTEELREVPPLVWGGTISPTWR